ncbi:replication initiation protein [Photobacterium leiognathi]|uniref:replication initiation protein n=1 Tax=Photobacterium leiognathi TaxID=553611 RepID=UPI0027348F7C|nr:replication initiation protein [Photobacterium leiognathi]
MRKYQNSVTSKSVFSKKTEFELRRIKRYDNKNIILPKWINLKNELIFSEYDLSATSQRLLYFVMSKFSLDDFYSDNSIYDRKGKFDKVNESNYSYIYEEKDLRSIIVPASILSKVINNSKSARKTKNYEPLFNAISQLKIANITINTIKDNKKVSQTFKFFDNAEIFILERESNREQIFVQLTFSIQYMPFVVACFGFTKVDFDKVCSFKSVYAMRFFHWFLYALKNKKSARFSVSIKEIRKRFKFSDNMYKQHFDARFIQKPIDEIMKNTDYYIFVEELEKNIRQKTERKLK